MLPRQLGPWVLPVLLVLAPLVAQAAEQPPLRLVLLPVEAINLAPAEAERYARQLEQAVDCNPGASLRRLSPDEQASLPSCGNEMACLQQLGQRLQADRLLALRVGRLMDTVVVRLMVFDAGRGVRQGTWQEVLQKSDKQSIHGAIERIAAGFLPPPPAPPPPWYARWWVWGIAGAVVAGSVTAAVLLSRDSGDDPTWVVTPPR